MGSVTDLCDGAKEAILLATGGESGDTEVENMLPATVDARYWRFGMELVFWLSLPAVGLS